MTSDRPGPARRHEHPRRPERGPVLETARLLGLQLLAVVGIATLIVVVVALVGPDDRTPTSTAADSPSSTTAAPSSTASTRSSSPSSTGTSNAPATTAEPIATATPDAALAKVDVLNQSAPGGSAQKVADQLQRAGWDIGRVSDFHGNISTTTVYWLTPDRRRQARQIAQNLGGVRVEQGFSTLVDGRISVVLVDKL
ncbi:MAG TPA: LytR C-terminal domain-containing protein [Actinomycetes bacterium]|jgi:cytoskeletal protein RodZ|nr:LytR C-terminal domain-containing protein [Actinomycetes bacterium]